MSQDVSVPVAALSDAPQGILERSVKASADAFPCPCGCGLMPDPPRPNKRFYSQTHRRRYWDRHHRRHRTLSPEAAPVIKAGGSGLVRSARLILGRLQGGPATNWELAAVGGLRYRERIRELRRAGHRIVCKDNKGTHVAVYSLEDPE